MNTPINKLPNGLKQLARRRQAECRAVRSDRYADNLVIAFDWYGTPEGAGFWGEIATGNFTPFYNCKVVNLKWKPITEPDPGYLEGEICNRDGCDGIIQDPGKTTIACYCHTGNAPCGHCTEQNQYCPKCGWEAENA